MFSGVTVSEHTYKFWTSSTAKYISINNIKVIKNINTTHANIHNINNKSENSDK